MAKGQLTPEKRLEQNFERLKTTNLRLRAKIAEQDKLIAAQQQTIETLQIQIAELQTMVFGKKKKPPAGHHESVRQPAKQVRSRGSFRRPLPLAHAITAEVVVPLPVVCACGGSFAPSKTTTHERFQEDIPLPELTPDYRAHLVTRFVVKRGICSNCGKATAARELSGQHVTLGPNIRLLVTHLVSVVGMSYAQVIQLCRSLYGITVSDGEIANTLATKHRVWLPAYEQLKADTRAAPAVHADETPWPIQGLQGAGYAWVLAAAGSSNSCFVLANSRGAPYAQALLGTYAGIRITDDYGVYRSPELPGQQQLCWAHLYRAIRDLRYNQNLPEEQLPYVDWWYTKFADIYQDLRLYLTEPYDEVVRATQSQELWQQLQQLCAPNRAEPAKLSKLKAQLTRAGQAKLFLCLIADTPCDNNRAERDLRPLVLKRKRSFGSKTEKGAQALATILSICTTTWRSNPMGYFASLAALG